ncbi:MAG: alpha-galactosidase, partial [Clostridia bacterium]|nr:alpha-galactosidase [Clostridia bacterium]
MSIQFHEQSKIFQLDSVNSSYVIGIFEGGYLLHYYYGAKIPAGEDFSDMYYRGYQASFIPYNKAVREAGFPAFYPGNAPMEYPTNGAGDFRNSALSILNEDGNTVTDIRYESHMIYAGKPRIEGLPSLYADENSAETLELVARDPYTNALVTLYYTVFTKLDAIVRSVKIENTGDRVFRIDAAASLCLDLPTMDYQWIHLWGQHCQERALSMTPLEHGTQMIGSKRGASGHFHNPFAALASHGTDEQHGEVYAVNLVYSGNFTISAEVDAGCTTRLMAGINDHDFLWEVKPGDSFRTPECVLVYSGEGLGAMSRTFHRLYLDHL